MSKFLSSYFFSVRPITKKKFEWTLKQSDKKVRSNSKRFWSAPGRVRGSVAQLRTRIGGGSAPKLGRWQSRWTFPGCDAWWAADFSLSLCCTGAHSFISLSPHTPHMNTYTLSFTKPRCSHTNSFYVSPTHSYINNNDDKLFLLQPEHNWWSNVCCEHKLLF